MIKSRLVHKIDISADNLISSLLHLSETETVCILDSCGVGHLGSHLMIAGIDPVETLEISNDDTEQTLAVIDEKIGGDFACLFTLAYDFGMKLLGIQPRVKEFSTPTEPDLFLARFDALVIHDYDNGVTKVVGNIEKHASIVNKLVTNICNFESEISNSPATISSNFSKAEYLAAIETIKEHIRSGNTYQTNLTQQLTANLPCDITPQQIFYRLRRDHPAPFAAFIKRLDSTVISASPERFFRITEGGNPTIREGASVPNISTSPIKGTRPRGQNAAEDTAFRNELLTSTKDRAENTMIVDLLRNDLGRVCEYGSVRVEKLCDLEEHPTFFHLVSTVSGELSANVKFSEILRALFPCGSITGAPKISTMRIVDEIETVNRGLSMGTIGYYVPGRKAQVQSPKSKVPTNVLSWEIGLGTFDLSVAIRTMVVRENTARFNVGGGIVIDSDPESEYDETLTKAKALLNAIGASLEFQL